MTYYIVFIQTLIIDTDSTVVRRLHHQLARELAARIALPTDTPASAPSRSAVGHQTVSRTRRPRRLKGVTDSSGGPEAVCRIPMEMSSVQALMDISLPRFAGLTDGLHQIHLPWSISSDSPASPATVRFDTSSEEDSRCSVDQMSVSSACLNLDVFSSSSEDDSKDLAERSDLSITLFCDWDEAGTRVNSDQVLSDGDFPEESVPEDKWQFVRRGASPPGGQSMGAAQDDRQYDPPLPVVDLVTGRSKPGKVSRTVSRTLLTLDLTVVCMTSAVVPPPGAPFDTVVPPAAVANDKIDVGTSVPVVTAPAPVVEQPSSPVREGVHVVDHLQPLLPLSGWSSSSSSPTLPWGATEDSSPPFSPNCIHAECSQDVPDEDSLFNVSPLSPGLLFSAISRGSVASVWGGTIADDVGRLRWFGSGLSDHIYALWTFSGVRVPIVLASVCVAVWFDLTAGSYSISECVRFGDLVMPLVY